MVHPPYAVSGSGGTTCNTQEEELGRCKLDSPCAQRSRLYIYSLSNDDVENQ